MSEQCDHSSSLPPLLPKSNTDDKKDFLVLGKVCMRSKWAIRPELICFCSRKRLGVFLLPPPPPPLDRMLVHRRVTPSIKLADSHLYTWVKRVIVRLKCFAQEHKTMSPARARTRNARTRDDCINPETNAPPLVLTSLKMLLLRRCLKTKKAAFTTRRKYCDLHASV